MMLNKILELDKKGYSIEIHNTDFETLEVAIEKNGWGVCELVNFEGLRTLEEKKIRMQLVLNKMEAELERILVVQNAN